MARAGQRNLFTPWASFRRRLAIEMDRNAHDSTWILFALAVAFLATPAMAATKVAVPV
jgi:hypothetical protein